MGRQIAQNETGTSDPTDAHPSDVATIQIHFVSAGEVVIEGSINDGSQFDPVEGGRSITDSGLYTLSASPSSVRLDVQSGEVNAWIE